MDWIVFIKEMIAPTMQIGVVLGVFLILTNQLKGLKEQLAIMNATIEAQKQTLGAVEHKAGVYKSLIQDAPEIIEEYKKFMQSTKDEIINHLSQELEMEKARYKRLEELVEGSAYMQEVSLKAFRKDVLDFYELAERNEKTLTDAIELFGSAPNRFKG